MKWLNWIELIIIALAIWAIITGIRSEDAILLGEGIFLFVGINYFRSMYLQSIIRQDKQK